MMLRAAIALAIFGFTTRVALADLAADERIKADAALAAGKFEDALSHYKETLAVEPNNRHALRESGRALHALQDFKSAADLLTRADRLTIDPDPELHYLLGEAYWTLGERELARIAHDRAKTELGTAPTGRMEKLWLARIHGRIGERDRADAIYDAMLATAPADVEVSLAQTEMHAAAKQWAAAERSVRRFLAHEPKHGRGLALLAWILEAQGKLGSEVELREQIVRTQGSHEAMHDYGRALERSGDWAGALDAYRRAAEMPGGRADLELSRSLARVDHRMSIELGAGLAAKSDPSASTLGWFSGIAMPFGAAHQASISAWHDFVSSPERNGYAGELVGALALQRRDARAIVGVKLGVIDLDHPMQERLSLARPGAVASVISGMIGGHLKLGLDGELGSVWRESPRTILEGGRVDSATAHVYGVALDNRLVIDSGAQARLLKLIDPVASPVAWQGLAWIGADFVAWRDFAREARGQILDEELLRPTFAADSLVVSYRHYEMIAGTDQMFEARMSLAERASIDELSLTARKVLASGRLALEARGGLGRDWVRELVLSRGGIALWFSPGGRARLSVSVDVAKESVRAIAGERRAGWMSYHVDL